ncbi:MAG: heme exporter protein CcmD [Acidimicrobiales bacterium]|nr:heme exporter protein CcmD [Acidimicrobiales bacterium]
MSHAGYVAVSYALVLGSTAFYAVWVIVKGRRLSRQVPPEDRRWL